MSGAAADPLLMVAAAAGDVFVRLDRGRNAPGKGVRTMSLEWVVSRGVNGMQNGAHSSAWRHPEWRHDAFPGQGAAATSDQSITGFSTVPIPSTSQRTRSPGSR